MNTPDPDHRELQREALERWGEGRLDEARLRYEAAIEASPPTHHALGGYRLAYAGVLAALELHEDARAQFELGLAFELQRDREQDAPAGDASITVAVARHFLGEHCVRRGDHAAGLAAVLPSIDAGAKCQAMLRTVQALALAGLNRPAEAHEAAASALGSAANDDQRERIRQALLPALSGGA
jgi:hypothetical protein